MSAVVVDEDDEITLHSVMDRLMDVFKVHYQKITKGSDLKTDFMLKPEGPFKIEGINPIYGERICWQTNFYRLKHIMSGRYLAISNSNQEGGFSLQKSITNNKDCMFMFMPV